MDLSKYRNKLIGSEEERAVSPVIGVILMVAITVILAAVIAAFVLDMGDSMGSGPVNAVVSTDVDNSGSGATDGEVRITIDDAGDADTFEVRGPDSLFDGSSPYELPNTDTGEVNTLEEGSELASASGELNVVAITDGDETKIATFEISFN
ncbi:type IV pilin [Natronorubrum halophilum]|uniref:type IV pilin n=1 Tax=Natronorubrum halophilum TaxID=1702106 RepID=UPI0010C23A1F|nr:type IV pilin N-terminal domain-containing protein [Natronorubrum halophilum]